MSSILSFDILSVVVLEPKTFYVFLSAGDAAAVNPNWIKTLLANALNTFFINGNPVFINGPRSLPGNRSNCIILDNWVFDSLIPVNDLLAKALPRFSTCVLVDNNLCGN